MSIRLQTKGTITAMDNWVRAYSDAAVVEVPVAPTGICTGVCHTAVAVDQYFWGQVKGPCAVFNGTESIQTGDNVVVGAQAAGVLALEDGATPNEGDVVVGFAMRAAASGDVALIFLTIE